MYAQHYIPSTHHSAWIIPTSDKTNVLAATWYKLMRVEVLASSDLNGSRANNKLTINPK